MRTIADFSAETQQARREWQDLLEVMRRRNLETRILYSAKLSFRFDREIKRFSGNQKLRELSTSKEALQQLLLLKEILKQKGKTTIRNRYIT